MARFNVLRVRETRRSRLLALLAVSVALLAGAPQNSFAQFNVLSVSPSADALSAQPFDRIEVEFSTAPDLAAFTPDEFRVFGSQSGRYFGTLEPIAGTNAVSFRPDRPMLGGERITVVVSDGARSQQGQVLPRPYVWQFTVGVDYGSGRFSLPEVVSLGEDRGPQSVVISDLDGDRYAEIVVVNTTRSSVSILRRNPGDEVFELDSEINLGTGAWHVEAADLNADGLQDLIVTDVLENYVRVLQNRGNLQFTTAAEIFVDGRPVSTSIADFNGDGTLDIAVTSAGTNKVGLISNRGSMSFVANTWIGTGNAPTSSAPLDFDHDGALDLVATSAGSRTINVYRNVTQGSRTSPGFARLQDITTDYSPSFVLAADVRGNAGSQYGDGWADFIVLARDSSLVTIYENEGAAQQLASFIPHPLQINEGPARAAVLVDVDTLDQQGELEGRGRDHDLDLVIASYPDGAIRMLPNQNNASFGAGSTLEDVGETPRAIAAGDLDSDGDMDIVSVNHTSDEVRIFYNAGARPSCVGVGPSPLAFGPVPYCESSTQQIIVANACAVPVDVVRMTSSQPAFSIDFTPTTLAPGAQASFPVTFSSTTIGSTITGSARVDFESAVATGSALVSMSGQAVGSLVSSMPTVQDFGSVVISDQSARSFQLRAEGNISADVGSISISDSAFTVRSAPTVVTQGNMPLVIEFRPTEVRSYEAQVVVTFNTPCQENLVLTVRGDGAPLYSDLVATRVTGPMNVIIGNSFTYRGEFRNERLEIATPVIARLVQDGVPFADTTVSSMAVGEVLTFDGELYFESPGTSTISLIIDRPENAVPEVDDIQNNEVSIQVQARTGERLTIRPNPFTPNADGFNDAVEFNISELALQAPNLRVFSLEGVPVRMLEQLTGPSLVWDGRNDSGQEMAPGLYLYVLRDGSTVIRSGHVTLAR